MPPDRPYDLAIFDFDGTLADTFHWFISILDDVAAAHGIRAISADEIEAFRGLSAREIIARLGVPMWKIPLIAHDMRRRAAASAGGHRLFPGVEEMLAEAAGRGVALAVVSSNGEETVRRVLGSATARLIGHFGCGASLFGKAAKLERARSKLATAAARTLTIGDEIRDAEAARSAGVAFGAVAWGYTHRHALEAIGPDLLFDRVADIAATLAPTA